MHEERSLVLFSIESQVYKVNARSTYSDGIYNIKVVRWDLKPVAAYTGSLSNIQCLTCSKILKETEKYG